jgi:prepilin-type N-terminal cleavage/methylation domain-containing protein
MSSSRPSCHNTQRGFTLVEAMAALTIISVAASALLLGISSTLESSTAAVEQAIAHGMARQLLDEVASLRYCEPGSLYGTLGPGAGERNGASRTGFDDVDDYDGLRQQPPTDRFGIPLGEENGVGNRRTERHRMPTAFFSRWRQEVDVYYVRPANFSSPVAGTSDYKAVHVRIVRDDPVRGPQELVHLTRIFSNVPSL